MSLSAKTGIHRGAISIALIGIIEPKNQVIC